MAGDSGRYGGKGKGKRMKVTVILKNGQTVEIDGANGAYWESSALNFTVLTIGFRQNDKAKVLASFNATEVAGYVIGDEEPAASV